MTAAIDGTNYGGLRSFAPTFTTASTAEIAIAPGSYWFCASQDCNVKFGITGVGAATALATTQPLVTGATGKTLPLLALQKEPVDIVADGAFFRVIGLTASGTLTINGPISAATNP